MKIANLFLILSLTATTALAVEGEPPAVTVQKAQYMETAEQLTYPARVSNARNITVPAEVEGNVRELAVTVGQTVRRGQTLLRLSNPDPVYEFKSFQVKAPFDGVVSRVDVVAGDRVVKGRDLIVIADPSHLKIIAHVTSDDLQHFTPGYQGSMQIGKDVLSVRVKTVSPQLDPLTGTAACELELAGSASPAPLVPGSIVQLRFLTNKHRALTFPEKAIVYRATQAFVAKVEENRVRYVPVEIQKQGSGTVEVSGAIKDGDIIIVSSQSYIAEGDVVKTNAH